MREAYFNEYTKQVLSIYLKEIFPLIKHKSIYLFGVEANRLLCLLNSELKIACKKAKLPAITSHGFRHALGSHLLKEGCDIRYIQAILGHKRLKNTEVYTKVEKDDLKRVLDTFHPRNLRSSHDEVNA